MQSPGSFKLPPLREDLEISEGKLDECGEPTWLIYDGLRHRHFRIDAVVYEVLSVWHKCITIDDLVQATCARDNIVLSDGDAARILAFLNQNKLCRSDEDGAWQNLDGERHRMTSALWHSMLRNYMFFKVPLWNPQSALLKAQPLVDKLVRAPILAAILGLGVIGLYLVSRQWDSFVGTFQYAFRWEGMISALVCLVVVKCCHELAHAFAAVRYGCKVPSMGIAFMMLTPMLYADVSDTWRLKTRHERASVALAGIVAEVAMACCALFAWSFLAEGPLRSAAFFVAVISLGASLLINLNPLMRFDGYYVLSDLLGVDNLQDRAFGLLRWKIREVLFDLRRERPEQLATWLRRTLIGYAAATCAYRLALFFGIALLVYYWFFKVLGIFLFVVEVVYLIGVPIFHELKHWWQSRIEIAERRRWIAVCAGLLILLVSGVFPWSSHVQIEAILEPQELVRIYPTRGARVLEINVGQGQLVSAGHMLVKVYSPEIEREIAITRIQLGQAKRQHARRGADEVDREATLELEGRMLALIRKIGGLEREREELSIRSPISGAVVEFSSDVHIGRWVNPREMIAMVGTTERASARGYVGEADFARIKIGAEGAFLPDSAQRPALNVRLSGKGLAAASEIEIVELTSQFGGRVAVQPDLRRRLIPVSAQFPVRFDVSLAPLDAIQRGVVIVSGNPESLIRRMYNRMAMVLIRESGF